MPPSTAQTADDDDDDPILRIALSDMDEETKKAIVATLIAERKQFVRKRAAELVREALTEPH